MQKVIEMGTKLFQSCLNVENITVPGTGLAAFQQSLPRVYRDKLPPGFSQDALSLMSPVELPYTAPTLEGQPRMILVGDTHGTFEVLENIFAREGLPSLHNVYLFNGDYVDRGSFSIEVFVSLLVFKLLEPRSVFMLRGNHEIEAICT